MSYLVCWLLGIILYGWERIPGCANILPKKDSFVVYHREQTDGVLDYTAIKSLFEDSEGDLWIGTWSSGLYRYVPSTGKFYAYPQLNERNSAHVIYEDTNKKYMGR